MTNSGFKTVTLNSAIIAEDGTAESITAAIINTFKDGGELLSGWKEVTERMFPNRPDLLNQIPAADLSIAAEGQTRHNNDFGRGHKALVTGKLAKSGPVERVLGKYHTIPAELRQSLIQFSREGALKQRKSFDEALERQYTARSRKEETMLKKKLDATKADFIDAIYICMNNALLLAAGRLLKRPTLNLTN